MRYFKFSILTGIGLFALAMFFLSQSIQGFLSNAIDSEEISDESQALNISLADSADFPDLSLDFPAGTNQDASQKAIVKNPTLSQQTALKPSLPVNKVGGSHEQLNQSEYLPRKTIPKIKLVTVSNQQPAASQALNILLLSQTTKQQRTSLIEELLRVDADLVRQIALKTNPQNDTSRNNVKTVQQISLTDPAQRQTISAGYAVPQTQVQNLSDQSYLIQQKKPVHLVASYRGLTLKTIGIPTQSGVLQQTVHVVPAHGTSLLSAKVLGKNLLKLNPQTELPLPGEMQRPFNMKLSQIGEFQPTEIIKLSGSGLVIGLNGTGDHNHSKEAIKALNYSVTAMNIDLKKIKTPITDGNLANVSIIAYVPNTGLSKGQQIECYITATDPGVNLSGGYLLPTALQNLASRDPRTHAMALGNVLTTQNQNKSRGTIAHGAQSLSDIKPPLVSGQGIPHLNFFLNTTNHQPHISHDITKYINQFLQARQSFNSKAMLKSSSVIMISLPDSNQKQAHKMAAQLLALTIPVDPSLAANLTPELILDFSNTKIETRGIILLQSSHLQHGDITLDIPPATEPPSTKLNDLLALMHHLQIPKVTQMQLLRELQQQGKIRAAYQQL